MGDEEHDPKNLVIGSGNFLKDRGYPNPDETRSKFLLLNEIAWDLDQRRLSFAEAGELANVQFPTSDARWTSAMMEKSIAELEDIRDRIRELPLPNR
jgi:hypothetical protein